MSEQAYPLAWPFGRPRATSPQRARFKVTMSNARDELIHEIALLGGSELVISTNIALRRDGFPHANRAEPTDKGVAVYFTYKKKPVCFACDRWDRIGDNLQAIRLTVAALRGIERWGTGDMVEAAFTGFVALPSQENPFDVLGVSPAATEEQIEAAYRQKAKVAHPDVAGGSQEAMQRLNAARERLKNGGY